MAIKILVLGKDGMLGSMVFDYLKQEPDFIVTGTNRKEFDAKIFLENSTKYSFLKKNDYIINCIGIIKPFCKDDDPAGVLNAIEINALFPHKLAEYLKKTNVKVIQIATDCVFSGLKGKYKEDSPHDPLDVYGKTKSLGEVFEGNFLNIRCSIIGPEKSKKISLLEWFSSLKEGERSKGFKHHLWNGVTTLQFAKLCKTIIKNRIFEVCLEINHTHHYVPNNTVTKYQLLKIMQEVFDRKVKVVPVSQPKPNIDRTLSTKYNILSTVSTRTNIKKALIELRDYINHE